MDKERNLKKNVQKRGKERDCLLFFYNFFRGGQHEKAHWAGESLKSISRVRPLHYLDLYDLVQAVEYSTSHNHIQTGHIKTEHKEPLKLEVRR